MAQPITRVMNLGSSFIKTEDFYTHISEQQTSKLIQQIAILYTDNCLNKHSRSSYIKYGVIFRLAYHMEAFDLL